MLYLDNANGQTMVTLSSSASGQQQQASSSFLTGTWTATPEVYLTTDGAVVKLQSERGSHYIRVHGSSIGVSEAFSLDALEQMQVQQISGFPASSSVMESMKPMEPMKPMKPMTMGDMQMSMNPMEMRMGNMEMRMGTAASAPAVSTAQRFCSQCGTPVKLEDRFCSNCGHRLGN